MISISKRISGRGVNDARTTAEKMRIKKRQTLHQQNDRS